MIGTIAAPAGLSGFSVERNEEGPDVLVAIHQQHAAREYRRRAHAVIAAEGTERRAPSFLTRRRVGDDPVIGEKRVHIFSVGGDAGRGGIVVVVMAILAGAGHLATPEDLASGAIESDGQQLVILRRRQKNAIAGQHWRRMSQRQRRFPDHVFLWAELGRHALGFDDTRAVGTAKSGPIGGRSGADQKDRKGNENAQPHPMIVDVMFTSRFTAIGIVWTMGISLAWAQGGFAGPGRYQIQNLKSGKVMDLDRNDQTTVIQFQSRGTDNQQWDFQPAGEGFFYILNAMNGRALEVTGGNSSPLAGRPFNRAPSQQWRIDAGNDGDPVIWSRLGKTIDVPDGSNRDGLKLQIYDLKGDLNQRFIFFRVGGGGAGPPGGDRPPEWVGPPGGPGPRGGGAGCV